MSYRMILSPLCVALIALGSINTGFAQEEGPVLPDNTPTEEGTSQETPAATGEDLLDTTKQKIDEISKDLDQSKQAQEVSAGILQPIYLVAEKLAFPSFHWIAFAVMATGVVSYTLQLVLGKLVVLSKMSFSFSEVMSDALGLAISVIGLVLTTQAAAENSTFTTSAAAVLSASAVGVVMGFIFYLWG